jgi:hypothetical protein
MVGDHLKAQRRTNMDITKLEGYKPDMTAEEKLALVEKYAVPDPDYSGYVKKELYDRTASELAAKKKELAAKMTEDELKEAERQASEMAMKAELETLRKEAAVSKHKAEFIGNGYDEKLAEEAAKAFADGDMAKFIAAHKSFVENIQKAAKAAALADGDPPPAGKNDPPKGDRAKLIEQYNEAEKRGDFVMCQTLQAQIKALPKE